MVETSFMEAAFPADKGVKVIEVGNYDGTVEDVWALFEGTEYLEDNKSQLLRFKFDSALKAEAAVEEYKDKEKPQVNLAMSEHHLALMNVNME